jgi:hypothetical protein
MQQQKSMSNLSNIGISHATSQPSLYHDQYQSPQFPPNAMNPYGTLPHKSPHMFYGAVNGGDPMASARGAYPYSSSQTGQTFFPPHLENVRDLFHNNYFSFSPNIFMPCRMLEELFPDKCPIPDNITNLRNRPILFSHPTPTALFT